MPPDPPLEVIQDAEASPGPLPAAEAPVLGPLPVGTLPPPDPLAQGAAPHGRAPAVGSTVHHYELLRMLGEGGMGTVYVARDTTLGRLVRSRCCSCSRGRARSGS